MTDKYREEQQAFFAAYRYLCTTAISDWDMDAAWQSYLESKPPNVSVVGLSATVSAVSQPKGGSNGAG